MDKCIKKIDITKGVKMKRIGISKFAKIFRAMNCCEDAWYQVRVEECEGFINAGTFAKFCEVNSKRVQLYDDL
jgi:hypothetical protein